MGGNRHGGKKEKPHTLRNSKAQQQNEDHPTGASAETNLKATHGSSPEPNPSKKVSKFGNSNDVSTLNSANSSTQSASFEESSESIIEGAFDILPHARTYRKLELLDPVVAIHNEALLRFFIDIYIRYPICRDKRMRWWPQNEPRSDFIKWDIPKWAAQHGFDVEHCFRTLGYYSPDKDKVSPNTLVPVAAVARAILTSTRPEEEKKILEYMLTSWLAGIELKQYLKDMLLLIRFHEDWWEVMINSFPTD